MVMLATSSAHVLSFGIRRASLLYKLYSLSNFIEESEIKESSIEWN